MLTWLKMQHFYISISYGKPMKLGTNKIQKEIKNCFYHMIVRPDYDNS